MYFNSKKENVQSGEHLHGKLPRSHIFLASPLVPHGAGEGGEGVNPSGLGNPSAEGFEPCDQGTLEAFLS